MLTVYFKDQKGMNVIKVIRDAVMAYGRPNQYIIELLKALTAYKLGCPSLIMKPSAFESSRHSNFRQMLPFKAQESGYIYFNSDEVLRRRIKNRYGLLS